MDLGSWLGLLAGVGGATVAIYGAIILLTDRATEGEAIDERFGARKTLGCITCALGWR